MAKIEENKIKEILSKLAKTAETYIKDPSKINDLLKSLNEKTKIVDTITSKLQDFPIMIDMIKDYFSKKYTKMPLKTILALIGAIIYVVNPMDLISDFIPAIGLVDDIAIVGTCLKLVDDDLKDYKKWRKEQSEIINVEISTK